LLLLLLLLLLPMHRSKLAQGLQWSFDAVRPCLLLLMWPAPLSMRPELLVQLPACLPACLCRAHVALGAKTSSA
jgi:hypothetical protein